MTVDTNPLVSLVSDVAVKLIFAIPALRNKLDSLLQDSSTIHVRVKELYGQLVQTASPGDLKQLEIYLTQYTQQAALISVFEKAFRNIFADGKVDVNDSVHFMTLVHDVVTCFNASITAPTTIRVSSECVLLFLKFALQCIVTLTLEESQEKQAMLLITQSFTLLQLTVAPIEVAQCTNCRCTIM